jgi:hypothetical protein
MRVQIPAYTDAWMKGDRFGEIVKIAPARLSNEVRAKVLSDCRDAKEIAHVRLDKSRKIVRVILDDCRPV